MMHSMRGGGRENGKFLYSQEVGNIALPFTPYPTKIRIMKLGSSFVQSRPYVISYPACRRRTRQQHSRRPSFLRRWYSKKQYYVRNTTLFILSRLWSHKPCYFSLTLAFLRPLVGKKFHILAIPKQPTFSLPIRASESPMSFNVTLYFFAMPHFKATLINTGAIGWN